MISNKKTAINKLADDNRGKAGIIITLVVIILAAIALWTLIIIGNIWGQEAISKYDYSEDEETLESTPTPTPTPDPDADDDDDDDTDIPVVLGDFAIAHRSMSVHRELDALAEQFNCMAVSLAVYDGDTSEFYTYEYGFADLEAGRRVDDETKFRVASLSNLVTAICVMTLVDEGKINLDSDVKTYFGYDFRNPNFPDTAITTRMLLQHTSSIFDSGAYGMSRNRNSSQPVQSLIEAGNSFRNYRPGTTFWYSNFGFSILGALCEVVSGMSLDSYARQVIFDPLDIDAAFVPSNLRDTRNIAIIYESDHSIWRRVDSQLSVTASENLGHDLHLASSNLTISAMDYTKILTMITGGGTYGEKEILSQDAVEEMLDTNFDSGLGYKQGLGIRYSEGNILGDGDYFWHSGSANGVFAQYIYNVAPNHGVLVITTGASIRRLDNGMVNACTDLAQTAWKVFGTTNPITSATDNENNGNDGNDNGSLIEVG